MPMESSAIPRGTNTHVQVQSCGGGNDSTITQSRSTLGVEEMVSEEEARRRREQLNRRPSYRMILKDLETVGDKPLKKEMDTSGSPTSSVLCAQPGSNGHDGNSPTGTVIQQQIPDDSADEGASTNFIPSNNGVNHLIRSLPPPTAIGAPGLKVSMPPPPQSDLRIGVPSSASNPTATSHHLSSPSQTHLSLGQLNLIAQPQTSQQGTGPRILGIAGTAEIPSQPQPQIGSTAQQPLLAAVNNLEMLGLKAATAPEGLSAAYTQNDWQNNIITTYNRQQLQQQTAAAAHLLQQQNSINSSNITSISGMSNSNAVSASPSGPLQQHHGTRQGSASLTSFITHRSDNEETNRKRQVRLLKNREAAKECRRKKKEYVKCLENRVAVLENQNKALIEELKTLKELYCRKEKGDS